MKLAVFNDFCAELEALWKALELSAQYHVFQSYEWLSFWQQTIGATSVGIKPWLCVVSDANHLPKMILPLGINVFFGSRVLRFLGGDQGDYLGPVLHNDWVTDVSSIESAWNMVEKAFPEHDVRHFIKMPSLWRFADNPMLKIWQSTFQDYAYSSKLPATIDEFRSMLKPKLRSDNNRQRKRLAEKGMVEFEVIEAGDTWPIAMDAMIEQKRRRYIETGVPDILSDSAVQKFYRDIPRQFSDGGKIHLSVLKLDGQILATHWGAVHRERFYFLMPTYVESVWARYSPGRLLLENLMEWCIQNDLKVFDFTIGGEEYKKNWCDEELQLLEHLRLATVRGIPYFVCQWLKKRIKRNRYLWNCTKYIYAWVRYGKSNGN